MFVERYLQALTTSDLRDDDQHCRAEALAASAFADLTGGSGQVFGSLLARAKYADGVPRKVFDAGNHNLAVLIRTWTAAVIHKGTSRKWLKIKHEWDIPAAHGMYAKIARMSLAHWLAGQCEQCHGTKVFNARSCTHCNGAGQEPIQGGAIEREKIADMVSELEGLYQSHSARAGAKLRRAA